MRKIILYTLMTFFVQVGFSQNNEQEKEREKTLKSSNNLVAEANEKLDEDKFIDAEVTYRKAIAKSGENAPAKYNLGNAYYNEESYKEAFTRYKQAGEVAETKTQKHKAYHNMGNVFMNEKAYEKAVEAYKEALRNDPTDDETRYNLALAKKMLEKQQGQGKNKDKNKDQKDNQDKDQNKEDKKDENKDKGENDQKKEGDSQEKNDPEQNKDGEEKKEDDKKKEQENKQGEPKEEQGEPKPKPGQLSPQQVKNILEAMANEEKKVQEKLNAKKVKGQPKKTEKDW
ncbi:tetratricopeptide repeat protein [Flavobacteriaceae bacterium M23B6Z8]